MMVNLLEQFGIPAESGKVKLNTSLPAHCVAEVDRIQMERLISNLVSNAIKYTPEGGSVNRRAVMIEDVMWNWLSRTPASAFRPSLCPTSSTGSTAFPARCGEKSP